MQEIWRGSAVVAADHRFADTTLWRNLLYATLDSRTPDSEESMKIVRTHYTDRARVQPVPDNDDLGLPFPDPHRNRVETGLLVLLDMVEAWFGQVGCSPLPRVYPGRTANDDTRSAPLRWLPRPAHPVACPPA